MSAPGAATEALETARRFIDAFNERDVGALDALAADDIELRRVGGEPLHGRDGVRTLVTTAEELDIRLVPLRPSSADEQDGVVTVAQAVRELIGPDDIERRVELEIRDGRVVSFAVRPLA
jgi:ketosteroid isomerase-like protein